MVVSERAASHRRGLRRPNGRMNAMGESASVAPSKEMPSTQGRRAGWSRASRRAQRRSGRSPDPRIGRCSGRPARDSRPFVATHRGTDASTSPHRTRRAPHGRHPTPRNRRARCRWQRHQSHRRRSPRRNNRSMWRRRNHAWPLRAPGHRWPGPTFPSTSCRAFP